MGVELGEHTPVALAQLGVAALRGDRAVLERDHLVGVGEPLRLVGDEDAGGGAGGARPQHVSEEVAADVSVDGRERIVEQVDVRLRVHGACQCDARLRPPERLTPFSPISVASPAGRTARSGRRAHA